MSSTGQTLAVQAPKNVIQLILFLFKNMILGIPKMIKSMVIRLLIIFIVVIIINTYLLVVKNEGFAPTPGNPWLDITALQGNIGWATTFWTFAMFFFSNIIVRIKDDGFKKFSEEVFGAGKFFNEKRNLAEKKAVPTLLFSIGITAFFTYFLGSKRTLLLYSLMAFFSFTKRDQSFLMYFITLLVNDVRKIMKMKTKLVNGALHMMTFGVWIGFFIGFLLRNNLYIFMVAIILIGLALYLNSNQKGAKAAAILLGFMGANYAYYLISGSLLADDGGWIEAGGTMSGWIGSQGAGTAVSMGVMPAAGGALGALLGGIFSGINPNDMIPDQSVYDDLFGWYDDMKDMVNTGVDDLSQMYDDASQTVDDVIDAIKGDLANGEDQVGDKVPQGDFTRDQDDLAKILGGLLGLDQTGDMIENGLKGVFDHFDKFSPYMKDMVKNSKVFDYVSKVFKGNPSEKLKWLKKTFESGKGAKAKFYKDLLGHGATFLGGLIDSYSNYYEHGDTAANAISKGMLSNASTVYFGDALNFIAKKGWVKGGAGTLAAWELGNQVLFGNTKMADIASPIAMVKGGVNWTYDYFALEPDVIQKRMDSGYYGENMKNLYYGSGMAKDFFNKPGEFYDELGNFTDVTKGGFKDMYKTGDEIFKLPDDVKANTDKLYSKHVFSTAWHHPLDSVRRAASDTGSVITKGAIMVGEGWGYIGKGLGEGSVYAEQKLSSAYNYMKSFF